MPASEGCSALAKHVKEACHGLKQNVTCRSSRLETARPAITEGILACSGQQPSPGSPYRRADQEAPAAALNSRFAKVAVGPCGQPGRCWGRGGDGQEMRPQASVATAEESATSRRTGGQAWRLVMEGATGLLEHRQEPRNGSCRAARGHAIMSDQTVQLQIGAASGLTAEASNSSFQQQSGSVEQPGHSMLFNGTRQTADSACHLCL